MLTEILAATRLKWEVNRPSKRYWERVSFPRTAGGFIDELTRERMEIYSTMLEL